MTKGEVVSANLERRGKPESRVARDMDSGLSTVVSHQDVTGSTYTSPTIQGTLAVGTGLTLPTRVFHVNAFQYPVPGTDWTPQVEGAHLAASKSAKKCWLPLTFLKVGDIITTYSLVGDAVEAATLTLDCKLVRVNKADPLTTTDITNGAIVQVVADGNFDVAASVDDETVATDKQYVLEILGTTGIGDTITVIGAEVSITRTV